MLRSDIDCSVSPIDHLVVAVNGIIKELNEFVAQYDEQVIHNFNTDPNTIPIAIYDKICNCLNIKNPAKTYIDKSAGDNDRFALISSIALFNVNDIPEQFEKVVEHIKALFSDTGTTFIFYRFFPSSDEKNLKKLKSYLLQNMAWYEKIVSDLKQFREERKKTGEEQKKTELYPSNETELEHNQILFYLNKDTIGYICHFLTYKDIYNLALVSHAFRRNINLESLKTKIMADPDKDQIIDNLPYKTCMVLNFGVSLLPNRRHNTISKEYEYRMNAEYVHENQRYEIVDETNVFYQFLAVGKQNNLSSVLFSSASAAFEFYPNLLERTCYSTTASPGYYRIAIELSLPQHECQTLVTRLKDLKTDRLLGRESLKYSANYPSFFRLFSSINKVHSNDHSGHLVSHSMRYDHKTGHFIDYGYSTRELKR